MARKARKQRDPELFDVEAGQRMVVLFDRARVDLGLATDAELWRKLGVSRDTAQAWMRGERPPSRDVGQRVASRLGMTYAQLLDAYYGVQPQIDGATLVAAFEWAIQQVRAGQVPEGVREAVERAHARSRQPRHSRQRVS